jgi:hypothetical protein
MPRYARSTVIVVTAVWLIAAASTGAFAERGSGSGNASSRVRLLVQLTGPPPTQQSGRCPARRAAAQHWVDRPDRHLRAGEHSS